MKLVSIIFGCVVSMIVATPALATEKLKFTCALPSGAGLNNGKFVQVIASDDENINARYVIKSNTSRQENKYYVIFPNNLRGENFARQAMLLGLSVDIAAKTTGEVKHFEMETQFSGVMGNCDAPSNSVNLADAFIIKVFDDQSWNELWYLVKEIGASTKPYCVTFR
jgi:hypothetical protein